MNSGRVRWDEVTAIFGGTFDPPHLGHRIAVEGLFDHPGVSKVLVIPTFNSPQKPLATPPLDRVEMARLCFDFRGKLPVELDLREIKRTGVSYTFDTLSELKRERGRCAFVIGSDQLANLESWYRFPEVLKLADWIVLVRKPRMVGSFEKTLTEWLASGLIQSAPLNDEYHVANSDSTLKLVDTAAPALSSTRIREELARRGQAPENSLLPEVLAYLKKRRLYGT